jgi:large subunit ribosomal protein L2
MALKTFKPTTPSQRQLVIVDRSELWKGEPVKALTEGLRKSGGRNNTGRITVRWRGGGAKRRYRIIDFKRGKSDMVATVERLEYDPNRTAFIALIRYEDGEQAYILAPQRLKAGDKVVSGEKVDVKPGNSMPMKSMPIGTIIHNVEMKAGKGGQMARAAGTYAQLVGRDAGYALLRLSSGEVRIRWLGRRPSVRGVAMNPIDHPHGGGEGRTSGGRHPVTPWGKPTKGKKTRHNKATDRYVVRRRNKK